MSTTESVLQTIEKLVLEFSWRRVAYVLILVALAASGLWAFEHYTCFFRLQKLDKETTVLAQLQHIEKSGFEKNDVTKDSYIRLRAQLNDLIQEPGLDVSLPIMQNRQVKYALAKWAAASMPWLLLSLIAGISSLRKKAGAPEALLVFVLLGVLLGALGMVIPTIWWPWFNLVIYPVGQVLLPGTLLVAVAVRAVLRERRNAP